MSVFQIVAEGHRGILDTREAATAKEALISWFGETSKDGDRKMIRGDRLILTTRKGLRRSYEARKA